MDSVLRKLFSGKGFRKTETNVFEIRRDFEFRPRGGRVWEGIRAGLFFGEFRRSYIEKICDFCYNYYVMEYLLPSILIIISYFLGTFFAFQGLRDPIDKPLIYNKESITLTLTILFGWVPVGIALYLAYINVNLLFAIILVVVRFIILPTILNNKMKKFMDKKGI